MRFSLILSLIIAVLAVIFALQNATPVTVHLGPWTFNGSLALVLMITLAIGVLIGFLASITGRIKTRKKTATAPSPTSDTFPSSTSGEL